MITLETRRSTTTGCGSYGPGHQLHWTHWKAASSAPTVTVSHVIQTGNTLELVIPGRAPLYWAHHDSRRIAHALEHATDPIVACPDLMALRIDGFWFNCAPVGTSFLLCG